MPLKVLYLDDEPDLCEIFMDEFSSEDVLISTFTNVEKAIQAANSTTPDLIFIDYRLPQTTGDKTAHEMPSNIPKYLITGESSLVTQYKFNGVFGKPWDRDGIRAVFAGMLGRNKDA